MGTCGLNLKEGVKAFLSLATQAAPKASIVLLSDTSDATGILTLEAITPGTSGNSLKVEITDPGPDDCALAVSMGGSGDNTLTIALGRTAASPNSAKNTVALIATAINAIVTSKKITATGSGTTSKKITATAAAADFTGGVDTGENGGGVSHAGYDEALVLLTLGAFVSGSGVTVTIEHSADNVTFSAITGASFGALTATSAGLLLTGSLRLVGLHKYIRAVSVVTGESVQHSVLFVFGGGQYRAIADNTHTFAV